MTGIQGRKRAQGRALPAFNSDVALETKLIHTLSVMACSRRMYLPQVEQESHRLDRSSKFDYSATKKILNHKTRLPRAFKEAILVLPLAAQFLFLLDSIVFGPRKSVHRGCDILCRLRSVIGIIETAVVGTKDCIANDGLRVHTRQMHRRSNTHHSTPHQLLQIQLKQAEQKTEWRDCWVWLHVMSLSCVTTCHAGTLIHVSWCDILVDPAAIRLLVRSNPPLHEGSDSRPCLHCVVCTAA